MYHNKWSFRVSFSTYDDTVQLRYNELSIYRTTRFSWKKNWETSHFSTQQNIWCSEFSHVRNQHTLYNWHPASVIRQGRVFTQPSAGAQLPFFSKAQLVLFYPNGWLTRESIACYLHDHHHKQSASTIYTLALRDAVWSEVPWLGTQHESRV